MCSSVTNSRDVLSGRGGDDCLFGLGGDDRLTGGTGADKLKGSSGNDRLDGDAGDDDIRGDNGNDDDHARRGQGQGDGRRRRRHHLGPRRRQRHDRLRRRRRQGHRGSHRRRQELRIREARKTARLTRRQGSRHYAPWTIAQAGWQRFAEADWAGARDAFAAAPRDADALDGLGQSLWWLGERDAAIEHRREAYAAYARAGRTQDAGRVAVYLAGEYRIDGREAESSGWLARARRLLADVPPGAERGWLAIEEAKRAPDFAEAEAHAREALAIAHPDIECMALAQLGRALVGQGRVDEGIALLDEAMTVALGGEASDPLACGDACCTTLVVCDGLADIDRATQWCEAVVEFTERRRFMPVQSWCRAIFGAVLVRSGDWERADDVLTEALARRPNRAKGAGHTLPLAVLADLRLKQGRVEEAARLLEGLDHDPVARPALVRLHLARGEIEVAAALGVEDDVRARRGGGGAWRRTYGEIAERLAGLRA